MEFSEAINRNHAVISVATVTPASQLPSSSSACCATASSHDGSLEAEILGLRHQLNVLQQHGTRRALHLRWIDRALLIWLYRRCPHILHAITIVKPETVVRWHRKGLCRLLAMESTFAQGTTADRQRGARRTSVVLGRGGRQSRVTDCLRGGLLRAIRARCQR